MFNKGKVKINIFLLPQDPDLYLTDLLLFQQKAKAFFFLQIIPLFKNMNLLFVSFEIPCLFFIDLYEQWVTICFFYAIL